MAKPPQIYSRVQRLEEHLRQENPLLQEVVQSFRKLDKISQGLGFLDKEESYAERTPWWPLISVLGTYSSGKSTFLNFYLNYRLQSTGVQAVDDKFTVICFTKDDNVRVLPGLALNSDPRFPLYRIGQGIEQVAPGEGKNIDSYLQLKTCPSHKLQGKILIDSPGFDADAQRTSTLRITDRIIDLSDLVLVFFDARHPEPGSMQDSLKHLVQGTVSRNDSSKFVYILNQIDVAAQEDNPEKVFAAWQRSLAEYGLTAGQYYTIYNPQAAVHIENQNVRQRFEKKRDEDLQAIFNRIEQVKVERSYRIVGMLEESAQKLRQEVIPAAQNFISRWRKRVLAIDVSILAVIILIVIFWSIQSKGQISLQSILNFPALLAGNIWAQIVTALAIILALWGHFRIRRRIGRRLIQNSLKTIDEEKHRERMQQVFAKNIRWFRSIFSRNCAGWNKGTQTELGEILNEAQSYVQKLNDTYTLPSGSQGEQK